MNDFIMINIVLLLVLTLVYSVMPENVLFFIVAFALATMGVSTLLYQIIKKI